MRLSAEEWLLLRAACGDPETTREAWAAWRAQGGDLDALGDGPLRLAAQLHGALRAAEVDDPDLPRLKGAQRHTWSRNQAITARLARTIATLHDAGVETVVLKGAALAALHYRHPGQRPMWDADLLVRPCDRDHALATLRDAGWTFEHEARSRYELVAAHAVGLVHPAGGNLDLHWHAQHEPADDRPLWDAAVELELHGVGAKAPAPEDLLLLACAHAQRYSPQPPIHLAADALTILRRGVDWERFTERSTATQLTLPAHDLLTALRDHAGADVPLAVLDALAAAEVPPRARLAYRAGLRPWSTATKLPVLVDHWARLNRLPEPGLPVPPLATYVAAGCGQPSPAALVRWAAAWPRRASIPSGRWRSASTPRASSR